MTMLTEWFNKLVLLCSPSLRKELQNGIYDQAVHIVTSELERKPLLQMSNETYNGKAERIVDALNSLGLLRKV